MAPWFNGSVHLSNMSVYNPLADGEVRSLNDFNKLTSKLKFDLILFIGGRCETGRVGIQTFFSIDFFPNSMCASSLRVRKRWAYST